MHLLAYDTSPNYKSLRLAYVFLLPYGIFGAHRFYLKQRLLGWVWLCTCGCFLLGVLVDIFLLPRMVRRHNKTVDLVESAYLCRTRFSKKELHQLRLLDVLPTHPHFDLEDSVTTFDELVAKLAEEERQRELTISRLQNITRNVSVFDNFNTTFTDADFKMLTSDNISHTVPKINVI